MGQALAVWRMGTPELEIRQLFERRRLRHQAGAVMNTVISKDGTSHRVSIGPGSGPSLHPGGRRAVLPSSGPMRPLGAKLSPHFTVFT